MSNPLDELRNTTKSLQQKKEDNLHKTQELRLKQQERLSKESSDRQKKTKKDAKSLARKSRRIKITILSIVIALLCAFLAISIRMVLTGTYTTSNTSELLSDKTSGIDANHKDYVPLKKFMKSIIADLQKKTDIDTIQWYSSLPMDERERYFKTIKELKFDDTWEMDMIKEDPKREKFSMEFKNDSGDAITFDIIYNPDMVLKVVKIY